MSKNYVYAHTQTKKDYKKDQKITSKQWQVYYYLLSISNYDSHNIENHRYVYKKDFSVSAAAKFLGISRPTIYTAISNLENGGLIQSKDNYYLLYSRNWIKVSNTTLKSLLGFSSKASKNIDLLRTYLILKKIKEIARTKEDMSFTKKDLVQILGHGVTNSSEYDDVRNYLALLSFMHLIDVKYYTEYKEGLGKYVVYCLQEVYDEVTDGELVSNIQAEMIGTKLPNSMLEELKDFI